MFEKEKAFSGIMEEERKKKEAEEKKKREELELLMIDEVRVECGSEG